MEDIFDVQDEISQAIVDVLKVKLVRRSDAVRRTPPNIEGLHRPIWRAAIISVITPRVESPAASNASERAVALDRIMPQLTPDWPKPTFT